MSYFMPKPSLWKNISDTIQLCEDKEVDTFPKDICLKVNVMTQLEFELTHFKSQSSTLATMLRGLSTLH